MKNIPLKIILGIVALAIVIGAVKLISGIFTGAFGLVNGLLNTVLGIVVVLALIIIVIWMFAYAKKNR